MNGNADLLVESYYSWIRNHISGETLNDTVSELTTPFLDRHNDHIQVYAERQSPDLFLLTDDGYIVAELKSSGVDSRGVRRRELLHQLISGYGVSIEGGELQTTATPHDLGQRLHNLVQAMLSVDDMFVLAQPTVQSLFIEDVAKFLDDRDIRYTPHAKFAGKSGLDHLMDFVIPKSRRAPERIVQVVNSPRRDRVENLLFAINDTRDTRGPETQFYALINDTKRGVAADIVEAFTRYSVTARPWSHRDEIVEELAA
ncbi:DUF1829 domain-containing protein [Amycolatopsis sp. ATCC 39116]|uniref:DUF1829 domain-containing protein n=1 Tax=Amycolatopsis sp. (strain ATCC 39116 / 75iv2) TaxID=385957 RepID=UPI00026271CD|nr:DUF1829 domain-containing protein [Amycolatopsis sp. ATCC 39116]